MKNGSVILHDMLKGECRTPIIIISGDTTLETERAVRSLPVAYFFTKPFLIDDLKTVSEQITHTPCPGQ